MNKYVRDIELMYFSLFARRELGVPVVQLDISRVSAANEYNIKLKTRGDIPYLQSNHVLFCLLYSSARLSNLITGTKTHY